MVYILMMTFSSFFYYLYEKTFFIHNNKKKKIIIFLLLSFLILVLFSGLRYDVGTDYFSYKNAFESGVHIRTSETGYSLV